MQIELHHRCTPDSPLYHEWKSIANSPLEDPDWLITWWSVYGVDHPARELQLVTMRDGKALIGVAPFYSERGRLRLLGTGKICTDHQQLVIAQPNDRQAAIAALMDWLIESPMSDFWRVIELECVDAGSATHRHFQRLQVTGRCPVFMADDVANCSVALAATWDDYLQSVSKNHRKRCRRLCRSYFDGKRAQYLSTDQGWDQDEAMATLVTLHNRRRRDLGESSVFEDRRFSDFQRLAFAALAANGMARMGGIELEGTVVAAEYELIGPATVYCYQSGLDPAARDQSPGTLSIISSIQRAIDDGKRHCDLMRGAEEYKTHWNAVVRPTRRIKAWRGRVSGTLALSSHVLWHGSKELLRDFVR